MIHLKQQSDSILFSVQAIPRAKKNAILGVHDGRLKISVTAPADKGKANQAILKLLAEQFGLRPAQLQLERGAATRQKVLRVYGVGIEEFHRRLLACLGPLMGE